MFKTAPITTGDAFELSIPKAQFDVLLALAAAMAPSLPSLAAVAANWRKVVAAVAVILARQTGHIKTTSHGISIWKTALEDLEIEQLTPAAVEVLDSISSRLRAIVLDPEVGKGWLDTSHGAAISWIRNLGVQRGLARLQHATPVSIHVRFDSTGIEYCASSSRLGQQLGWSFQQVERALYGALILDMFLQHEYLSHMLPRNTFLSRDVREVWLCAALFLESERQLEDPNELQVRWFLWEKFRLDLSRQFDPRGLEFFGPSQLDHLATRIHICSPDTF